MDNIVKLRKRHSTFKNNVSDNMDINQMIEDKINQKMFYINTEIKELKIQSPEVISFHQLGFKGLEEPNF